MELPINEIRELAQIRGVRFNQPIDVKATLIINRLLNIIEYSYLEEPRAIGHSNCSLCSQPIIRKSVTRESYVCFSCKLIRMREYEQRRQAKIKALKYNKRR